MAGGCHPHAPTPARSLPWQMPDYKHATLQDEEGPEPVGDGSASPDSVEVRSALAPPFFPSPSFPAPTPTLTLSQSLPAARWAAGAGRGAKAAPAVSRDVLGGSQNAAESVPGPSSFLAAGGAARTRCRLARAGALGTRRGMTRSPPSQAPESSGGGKGHGEVQSPHSATAGSAPAQVGFRKGPGPLLSRLASRTQLELVLCAVALSLALLLGIAVVALAIQYSRGREGPRGPGVPTPEGEMGLLLCLGALPAPGCR